jgi:putative phosphoesterase
MRLAVISDTHLPKGARRLPDACLERLGAADAILHAGDFVAAAVLEGLEALGPPVHAVHGNVDEPALRARLPAVARVVLDGVRLVLVHDAGPRAGRLARLRARFPDADLVVFGHSHLPLHERSEDGAFQILNPGSPTERRRAPHHTMACAELADGRAELSLISLD